MKNYYSYNNTLILFKMKMGDLKEYINEDSVIKDEIYNSIKDSIICQICRDIIIIPMMCMECPNSFCLKCIEKWNYRNKTCPNRCRNPNYKFNKQLFNILSKLTFECINCNNNINYEEMIKHFYSKCGKEEVDNKEFTLDNKKIFEKIDDKRIISKIPPIKLNSKLIIFIIFTL